MYAPGGAEYAQCGDPDIVLRSVFETCEHLNEEGLVHSGGGWSHVWHFIIHHFGTVVEVLAIGVCIAIAAYCIAAIAVASIADVSQEYVNQHGYITGNEVLETALLAAASMVSAGIAGEIGDAVDTAEGSESMLHVLKGLDYTVRVLSSASSAVVVLSR
jgi:hypothetical protein